MLIHDYKFEDFEDFLMIAEHLDQEVYKTEPVDVMTGRVGLLDDYAELRRKYNNETVEFYAEINTTHMNFILTIPGKDCRINSYHIIDEDKDYTGDDITAEYLEMIEVLTFCYEHKHLTDTLRRLFNNHQAHTNSLDKIEGLRELQDRMGFNFTVNEQTFYELNILE